MSIFLSAFPILNSSEKNGFYYIDKTGLIEELLKTDATQVPLITRPRCFGTTLGMSMMAEFFDIRRIYY